MAQKQQNSPSQGAGFSGFPTRHPMSGNSNVLLAGVNLDNREYVIPTMVGGEKLSMNDAIRVARNHGLDHYPSFNSVTEASQWAETNHGNISADGKLNPTTQNNTNIMAQNTFRQTIMGNAQPKPFWEQPVPTKAPPAMVGPAAPTPKQWQSMEPSTAHSDFDLRWQEARKPDPNWKWTPTPEDEAELYAHRQLDLKAKEAARGGSGIYSEEAGYNPPSVEQATSASAPVQSQEGVVNPVADQAPQSSMSLSQQGIADALARTKAEGVEVDPNSPQANFLREKEKLGGQPMNDEQIAQATRLATSMGTTFDPETGYSRQPFLDAQSTPQQGVQQGSGLTTVGGAPLNEFLSGAAMPERGFARAENAMYGDNSLSRGLGGDAATKAFQDASAAREGRMGLSNRPGVDVPSLDMQRSRMDAGLDPVEGAPTGTDMSQQQQRDALERGFDPATGQPIQGKTQGVDTRTPEQIEYDQLKNEKLRTEVHNLQNPQPEAQGETPYQEQMGKDIAKELSDWNLGGRQLAEGNLSVFNNVIEGLESGRINTRTALEFLPTEGLSEFARQFSNVPGQQAVGRIRGVIFQGLRETLGAQFTQKEGERLVAATYDPKLPEEENAVRLKHAATILEATIAAKDNMKAHMDKGGSVANYDGKRAKQVLTEGLKKLEQDQKNASGVGTSGATSTGVTWKIVGE